jgi:hypothetical protein
MKGLSVALTVLLLFGAEQLAAHLKRSRFAPARQNDPGLPVDGGPNSAEQHPSVVLHR